MNIEQVQDQFLKKFIDSGIIKDYKLCGGTALSRIYLNHRVSYDLDFFMPHFHVLKLNTDLKTLGFKFRVFREDNKEGQAQQLHCLFNVNGEDLKVSFVQDCYYELYPKAECSISDQLVTSEPIEGIYHRKLRTIIGSAVEEEYPVNGRQTARDLFDLYILNNHTPLEDFINSLPYEFPREAFYNGIDDMPWMSIIPELNEIITKNGHTIDPEKIRLFFQHNILNIPMENILFENEEEITHSKKPKSSL